jgi:hypothetical protein
MEMAFLTNSGIFDLLSSPLLEKKALIMFIVLLALFISQATSPPPPPQRPYGTVEQFHVTVRKQPSLHVATITAAIIRITFPNHPKITITPTDSTSLHGLTQLICNDHTNGGRYQLYESTPVTRSPNSSPDPSNTHHGTFPRRLLPMWHNKETNTDTIDPLANLLLRTALHHAHKPNEHVLLFPLKAIQTVVAVQNGTQSSSSLTQTMSLTELSNCNIRFVHPLNQLTNTSMVMNDFVGDVPLSTNRSNTTTPTTTATPTTPTTAKTTVQKACRAAVQYTKVRQTLINKANRLSKRVGFLPTDQDTCVAMPRRHKPKHSTQTIKKPMVHSEGLTSLAETAAELFVDGEQDMAHAMTSLAKIGVPELGGVLMIPMKDIAKDFAQLAAGDMADSTTGVMEGTSAGQVDQSLTEQITGLLSRGLKSRLTETLVPPLKETVVTSVTSSTTQLFQLSLTKILTQRLEKPLMEKITQKSTNHMTSHLDTLIPEHTARLLAKDLNHMLSRSIPHSVVPALVHTLTHSPMQDYYCYYCYHHKTYCQYCNYAPSQMYYAEYYTGYYSTYYSDYYGDYALRQRSAEDMTRKKEQEDGP